MLEISDRALGQISDLPPLPPFARAHELLADALPLLDAPSRISVTESARRNIRLETRGVWQNFDPDVTPYMVEPSNTVLSRLYKGGAFVGPAQSGKTMALITTALRPVVCDPSPVLIIHMDRPSRDRWVEESLNPVIQNSPEIADRLGRAREDSTFSRKRFRGMRLNLGYPTPQWLSSAKYKLVCLTDFDHFPPELGVRKDAPEGSAFTMALQRIKSYLSRGFVLAESTPAWPVVEGEQSNYEPGPHEMPLVKYGIVPLYNRGTRGRWYWECRDCGELFQPVLEQLHFNAELSPRDAGESAEMECPFCHCLIGSQHKNELNRAALLGRGGWLHETDSGDELVPLGDSKVRGTEIASWALNGAAATFANWSDLVSRKLEAEREMEKLGDDLDLARFYYTDIGVPYKRAANVNEGDLSLSFLRDNLQDAEKGVAPDWARFVVISVDVQGTYFPVQITAFGEEGQAQVVDRFDLTVPPADAPNMGQGEEARKLDPARYFEDWKVLEPLAARVISVAGADHGLSPVRVVVDFQGRPGVSDNAEKFLRGRRRAQEGKVWRVSRGQGGWKTPFRIRHDFPDRGHGGKQARGIKLLTIATDRLKDTFAASLKKATGGSGAFFLPSWMRKDEDMLGEYVAEERLSDGWAKKPGEIRNEGIDLSVMARAGAEDKGLLKIDWSSPPKWALGGIGNENAVVLAENAKPRRAEQEARRAPTQINYLKRG
ncbi:terminase gpA endonuclease subunit [Pelagimonas varians]|nr:terminase gpA endonuclease subunit [Pelagimonas varians]